MTDQQPEHDDIVIEDTEEVVAEKKAQNKKLSLKDQLKQCQAERQEYLTGWQTARAELVNYKKQHDQQLMERTKFANERLIGDLLPVLDSFTMAMGNKEAWEAVPENWRIGVEYIHTQLTTALEGYQLTVYGQIGDQFDPNLHEPIDTEDAAEGQQADTISQVLQKGYKLGEKVIRPAKIKVFK